MDHTTDGGGGASRALDTLAARLALALVAFVAVATTLVGGLEYVRGREELVTRARAELDARGRLVGDRLERAIDQRRRLVGVWPELEAAQDLAVDDVDKRLASSLVRLAESFGGRSVALAVGVSDTVVAASAPSWYGTYVGAEPWARIRSPGAAPALRISRDARLGPVVAATAPVSAVDGRPLGDILLLSPWDSLLAEAAGRYGETLDVALPYGEPADASPGERERLRGPPVTVPVGPDTIRLTMTMPVDEALRPLRSTRHQLILLALVVLAVTVPAAVLLARSNTAALRRLTDSAFRVQARAAAGPLAPDGGFRAPPRAPREVRVLASALSTMVERLEASRAEMARQESLAAMGTMAAVLAHEIRTPLSVLRGSADMLAKRVTDDDRGAELVSFVEEEILRLERLVSDLLVFARPRTPELGPADLAAVGRRVTAALGRQAEEAGVVLRPGLAGAPVQGDEEQLYQVALNLVSNALEASEPEGEVWIRTGVEGDRAFLEVADGGRGIPADALEQVWTPFFTTRRRGTGLGLPLVRRIARAHGGDASIESQPGTGTRVVVTLPARKGELA